jgi:hypothetical protein
VDVVAFRVIATGLPIAGLIGLLTIALWSVRQWRSDRVAGRGDRPIAIAIAVVLGLAFGGGVVLIGVGLAAMDGPPPGIDAYVRFLPVGLILATPIAIGAIAGYVAVVRTRVAQVALAGTLLGGAAAIGLIGIGGSLVQSANARLVDVSAADAAAELAARSSVLTLSVSEIHADMGDTGADIRQIRLRATVAAIGDVRLATGGKESWPRFSMRQIGSYPILDAPSPSGPRVLAAGSTTSYDLIFDAPQLSDSGGSRFVLVSTFVQPTVGDWLLTMQLEDEAGLPYEVTTPVLVAAGP